MKTQHANQSVVMPVLMAFTPATAIEKEDSPETAVYDPVTQIVYEAGRVVGTRSLKTSGTRKKRPHPAKDYTTVTDRKNAIDDSKSVK